MDNIVNHIITLCTDETCYKLTCGSQSGSYGCFQCNSDIQHFYKYILSFKYSIIHM